MAPKAKDKYRCHRQGHSCDGETDVESLTLLMGGDGTIIPRMLNPGGDGHLAKPVTSTRN